LVGGDRFTEDREQVNIPTLQAAVVDEVSS